MNKNGVLLGFALSVILLSVWALKSPTHDSSVPVPLTAGQSLPPNAAAFFSTDNLPTSAASKARSPSAVFSGQSSSISGSNPQSTQVDGSNNKTTAYGGIEPVKASFKVGQKDYHLQPDRFGAFPRVVVGAKQIIPISVQYSQGDVGETVTAQTVDGGGLKDGKHIVQQAQLDNQLSAQFTFQAGTQVGIYRVAVSQRGQIQTLQFWVGPLPQMRSVAQSQ